MGSAIFCPPKPSTYTIEKAKDPSGILRINLKNEWEMKRVAERFEQVEVFFEYTSRRTRLACIWIESTSFPKFTVLFNHGSTVDLGIMCNYFLGFSKIFNCNVFSYDYSGYGASSGSSRGEETLYEDIDVAWRALQNRYQISADKTILYGQSLGTAAALELAVKSSGAEKFAALVLHSPFLSLMRIGLPQLPQFDTSCFGDSFVK